ncbi:uncharacterized protein Dana_GF28129 [Drosophila ananassae]|uniref:Uncharacterized protein n=1 Tax=Drosophila ananassae TaxID=7217 RepID=A0A0P8XKV4_DROAN|nr:uncharacterized protein Dana_GF28129 [Drosophila ananassae]
MDLRTWKKVLLQWVNECSFIESNYITLEQTDIEGFFTVYVQQAEAETEVAQALQSQLEHPTQSPGGRNTRRPTALQAFIKEIYPEFTLHLDNFGHLVGSDYLYVYTLLLHYTCVKRPSEFFHSICKKLSDATQTCVASFFQQTMDRPQLTRDCLRQAIANVACVIRTTQNSSEVPGGGGGGGVARSAGQYSSASGPETGAEEAARTGPSPGN